jgi:hypothetical protein
MDAEINHVGIAFEKIRQLFQSVNYYAKSQSATFGHQQAKSHCCRRAII